MQIVKCKECKHYIAGFCCRDVSKHTNRIYYAPDDFCSYGVVKSEPHEKKNKNSR